MGHVVSLLLDASLLLEHNSIASSLFLSITALEETAKIHIGIYRKENNQISKRQDSMYSHPKKHIVAIAPTLIIGERLKKTIGEEERLKKTMIEVFNGFFVNLRESSLYVDRINESLVIPKNVISFDQARELLLLAIEIFDDALVGYTNHSFLLSNITDKLFEKWA